MGIMNLVKRIFSKEARIFQKQLEKLKDLPKEEATEALGKVLYENCVKYASDFVAEELSKKESPFKDLNKNRFFQEIMLLNIWILEKTFGKRMKPLIEKVYLHYVNHFNNSEFIFDSLEDYMTNRLKIYHETWDDYTGHQDKFGLAASRHLFNDEKVFPEHETSFWIISYAHSTMKRFSDIKKTISISWNRL